MSFFIGNVGIFSIKKFLIDAHVYWCEVLRKVKLMNELNNEMKVIEKIMRVV